MKNNSKIFVAGHLGLVGSALVRLLESKGYTNLLLQTSAELNLANQPEVGYFFRSEKPALVFMAAGHGGGISANTTYPADFMSANLEIQNNVLRSAWQSGTEKLLFIACSCIYPKDCPQPMAEDSLLDGPVEPTSEAFAIAKIAGIKMCQAYGRQYGAKFISVVPATLYGPEDDFDPENSHFIAAFISKFHRAKVEKAPNVVLWGSGTPERDLLYVDDFAEACVLLMEKYDGPVHMNAGAGRGISIREAAGLVKDAVGFEGDVFFDETRPDGAPRKVLDSSRMRALGWGARTPLLEGLRKTYAWYASSRINRVR